MRVSILLALTLGACMPQNPPPAVGPASGSQRLAADPWAAPTPQPQLPEPEVAPQPDPAPAQSRMQLLMGLRQTGIGGSSYMANVGWYVLFDDGRVLPTLPSEGLEGLDERAYAGSLGTYAVNGNTIEMAFDNYHLTFTPNATGGLDSREGSFWPAASLDGATLDGAYAPRSGPPDIAFTRDGRFQTNGMLINTGVNGLQSTGAGAGTYRIAQNTLTLAFSSGKVARISVSTLHADELPAASGMFFGGFEYHRVQ